MILKIRCDINVSQMRDKTLCDQDLYNMTIPI